MSSSPLRQPFLSPSITLSDDRRVPVEFTNRPITTTTSTASSRLVSLDLLRGLIMMVMVWDHTKDYVVDGSYLKNGAYETWSAPFSTYDNNVGYFLARAVSHWCAPGFFMLMGMGMVMLQTSRTKRGWSSLRIMRHFAIRGVVLIILGRIVCLPGFVRFIKPSMYGSLTVPDWAIGTIAEFEVLTALGLTMITVGIMLPGLSTFRTWALGPPVVEPLPIDDEPPKRPLRSYLPDAGQILCTLLAIGIMAASNAAIVYQQDGDPTQGMPFPRWDAHASTFWEITLRFLIYPGNFTYGNISYPLIPWSAVCLLGVAMGWDLITSEGRSRLTKRALFQSIVFGSIFVIIRTVGGSVGNYRGRMRGDLEGIGGFISFFAVCKYPPSPAYICVTLSLNLAMLSFLTFIMEWMGRREDEKQQDVHEGSMNSGSWYASNTESVETRDISSCPSPLRLIASPMLIFGRVPLFYYTIHWFVLGIFQIFTHIASPGLYLPYGVLFWVALVSILYYPCLRYGRFKESTPPDSLWRLL